MADYKEKRQFRRLKVNFIVYYAVDRPIELRMIVDDKEVSALMLDLSQAGMAILTNHNIPVSTILSIKFTLINNAISNIGEKIKKVNILGEVKNNIAISKSDYRLGILFKDADKKDRSIISEFVMLNMDKS
ncbi:MAG: PilZ domain-containing protein [Candidatus Omnitrophota bacterium]